MGVQNIVVIPARLGQKPPSAREQRERRREIRPVLHRDIGAERLSVAEDAQASNRRIAKGTKPHARNRFEVEIRPSGQNHRQLMASRG